MGWRKRYRRLLCFRLKAAKIHITAGIGVIGMGVVGVVLILLGRWLGW